MPNLHEISPESGFFHLDLEIFRQNLGFFFTEIWNFFRQNLGFWPEFGFFARIWVFSSVSSGFSGFRGRETETDPLESIFGVENLPPTAEIVGSARCQIGPIWFSGWVRSPDGFGQPYSLGVYGGFLERHISFYSLVPIPKFEIHVSFYSLVYSSNKIIP